MIIIEENNVNKVWRIALEKLYYHRLFDNPNSQIEYMIERIKDRQIYYVYRLCANFKKDKTKEEIEKIRLSYN